MNEPMVEPSPLAWPRRVLLWACVCAVLGGVFAAYLQPALVVDLANRLWACF